MRGAGSHKLNIAAPPELVSGQDDLARLGCSVVVQPALASGDVLLCCSSLMHGLRHWRGPSGSGGLVAQPPPPPPPTLLCCEFVGSVAPPSGEAVFATEQPWMRQLTVEQRVVMGLRCGHEGGHGRDDEENKTDEGVRAPAASDIVISDGRRVRVRPAAATYHPRQLGPVESPDIDADEQFFFELNGFLVLRGVLVRHSPVALN